MKHRIFQKLQTGNKTNTVSLNSIQRLFLRTQLILILSLAMILGLAGALINLHFETGKRDQNLQNVAGAIARSPILFLRGDDTRQDGVVLSGYLDSLKETLEDIDVISIVNQEGIRVYHSNPSLIGTKYDGNLPDFSASANDFYTVDETGPSGSQRRAYAAIYNEDGEYAGFVMAIMLMENIQSENLQMFLIFLLITVVAILIELIISGELSRRIKMSLMGYEPDVFTAMYKMRDNILETLEEGILAVDKNGVIQFVNEAAVRMLSGAQSGAPAGDTVSLLGQNVDALGDPILSAALTKEQRECNIAIGKADILLDHVPIREEGRSIGTIAILHDRAEYTKLMEDLSGTRYLVDSMRANNHDFNNKLHVILGLIQMEMYDKAALYIQNITMVQRENISQVMHAVNEPSVAALLIGKIARASELNVKFVLREGCCYAPSDLKLPSEMLITVIGNLLDNAFDAMNTPEDYRAQKELLLGIYSRPGAVLITVDDTGTGIRADDIPHIFENGYSTKGEGRGTGLYQVKTMVENYGGSITVESQEGVGTSFTVSFASENKREE